MYAHAHTCIGMPAVPQYSGGDMLMRIYFACEFRRL